MKGMKEYFDAEAELHDELFIQRMRLEEFYDEVENVLKMCSSKSSILVLGCGSGLEIERIKFPCDVVAVDISEKMLKVLREKKLYEKINLTTICASFLELDFENNKYDTVLSCYAMHHFSREQKLNIYRKVYSCLKEGGVFINGDSMATSEEEEKRYMKEAEQIYKSEIIPFASLHIDVPLCWVHEKEVVSDAGFQDVKLIKEWTNTKLYLCTKN